MHIKLHICILITALHICCNSGADTNIQASVHEPPASSLSFDSTYKTVHVFVALCDNKYQGIVPVPASIGNGQNANSNLYWGAGYGIRSFFQKSNEWTLVRKLSIDSIILERLVFKHKTKKYFLVADAYNGKYIQKCTENFLKSCAGLEKDTLRIENTTIGTKGNARLAAYIGHNGLMDFKLNNDFVNKDNGRREAIILACASKQYFASCLKPTGAHPLVWTTNFMCPEAYTLHDALRSYINKESNNVVRQSAARAYAKYQKCSERAALGLLVSGW